LKAAWNVPDEIVFFGSASDEGFLLARLIGSKMQVEKAVVLAKALEREGALDNAVEAYRPNTLNPCVVFRSQST
jgi:hypothetical protein